MASINPYAAGARAYYNLMQDPTAQTISLGSADVLKASAGNEVFRRKMIEGYLTGGDFTDEAGEAQFLIGINRADGEDGLSAAELALATQSTLDEVAQKFGVSKDQTVTVEEAIARLDDYDKADGQADLMFTRGSLDEAGREGIIESLQQRFRAWLDDSAEIVDCAESKGDGDTTVGHSTGTVEEKTTYTVKSGYGFYKIADDLLGNAELRKKMETKYGTTDEAQLKKKIAADLETYVKQHPDVGGSSLGSSGKRIWYFYANKTFVVEDALGLPANQVGSTGGSGASGSSGSGAAPAEGTAPQNGAGGNPSSGSTTSPPASSSTPANPSGVTTESSAIPAKTPQTGSLNFNMRALVNEYVGRYPALEKYAGLLERYAQVQQGKRGYNIDYARQLIERLAPQLTLIEQEAQRYGVPPKLAVAVVLQESGARSNAVSGCGAKGPWQFMPGTARDMGLSVGGGVDERTDWRKSTNAAMKYLKCLLDRYNGDARCALAAYNWGMGNVDKLRKGHKSMPNETSKYTSEIPYYVGNINDWS